MLLYRGDSRLCMLSTRPWSYGSPQIYSLILSVRLCCHVRKMLAVGGWILQISYPLCVPILWKFSDFFTLCANLSFGEILMASIYLHKIVLSCLSLIRMAFDWHRHFGHWKNRELSSKSNHPFSKFKMFVIYICTCTLIFYSRCNK